MNACLDIIAKAWILYLAFFLLTQSVPLLWVSGYTSHECMAMKGVAAISTTRKLAHAVGRGMEDNTKGLDLCNAEKQRREALVEMVRIPTPSSSLPWTLLSN